MFITVTFNSRKYDFYMIQVICVKYHVIQKELEKNNAHRGGHIIFGVDYFSVISRINSIHAMAATTTTKNK